MQHSKVWITVNLHFVICISNSLQYKHEYHKQLHVCAWKEMTRVHLKIGYLLKMWKKKWDWLFHLFYNRGLSLISLISFSEKNLFFIKSLQQPNYYLYIREKQLTELCLYKGNFPWESTRNAQWFYYCSGYLFMVESWFIVTHCCL